MAYKLFPKGRSQVSKGDSFSILKLNQYFGGSHKFLIVNKSLIKRKLKEGKGAGVYAHVGGAGSKEEAKELIKQLKMVK